MLALISLTWIHGFVENLQCCYLAGRIGITCKSKYVLKMYFLIFAYRTPIQSTCSVRAVSRLPLHLMPVSTMAQVGTSVPVIPLCSVMSPVGVGILTSTLASLLNFLLFNCTHRLTTASHWYRLAIFLCKSYTAVDIVTQTQVKMTSMWLSLCCYDK